MNPFCKWSYYKWWAAFSSHPSPLYPLFSVSGWHLLSKSWEKRNWRMAVRVQTENCCQFLAVCWIYIGLSVTHTKACFKKKTHPKISKVTKAVFLGSGPVANWHNFIFSNEPQVNTSLGSSLRFVLLRFCQLPPFLHAQSMVSIAPLITLNSCSTDGFWLRRRSHQKKVLLRRAISLHRALFLCFQVANQLVPS